MRVYRTNPSGTTYDIADHPLAGCRAWFPRGFDSYYVEARVITRQGVPGVSDGTEIRVVMTEAKLDRVVQVLAEAKARE